FSHFARGLGLVRGVDLLRSSHYKRHYREKLATVPSYINSLGRGGYTRWSQELTWPLACSRLCVMVKHTGNSRSSFSGDLRFGVAIRTLCVRDLLFSLINTSLNLDTGLPSFDHIMSSTCPL